MRCFLRTEITYFMAEHFFLTSSHKTFSVFTTLQFAAAAAACVSSARFAAATAAINILIRSDCDSETDNAAYSYLSSRLCKSRSAGIPFCKQIQESLLCSLFQCMCGESATTEYQDSQLRQA